MGLPGDPAAFVAEAERAINDRDAAAVASVYAEGALVEYEEVHTGGAEIGRFWERYLADLAARDLSVRKTLTTASGDTIAGKWEGIVGGRTESKGVEYWRFDGKGLVYEHRMYGHLAAEPPEGPLQRLRSAWAQPAAAFALLREQRKRR
jgi:nuclear transport factor 2 (NTF2) superfamily protein